MTRTDEARKKEGYKFVSFLKKDGLCCNGGTEDELSSPSSDSEDSNNESGGNSEGVVDPAFKTQHIPPDKHQGNTTLSPPGSASNENSLPQRPIEGDHCMRNSHQCKLVQPGLAPLLHGSQEILDPTQAKPRSVDNLITLTHLTQTFPNLSAAEINNVVQMPEQKDPYLNGGIRISTARNCDDFRKENRAYDGFVTTQQQHAPMAAEHRKTKDPEATDNSEGLHNNDNEYTWS